MWSVRCTKWRKRSTRMPRVHRKVKLPTRPAQARPPAARRDQPGPESNPATSSTPNTSTLTTKNSPTKFATKCALWFLSAIVHIYNFIVISYIEHADHNQNRLLRAARGLAKTLREGHSRCFP